MKKLATSFADHACTMLGTKAMIVSRDQQPGLGLLPSFGLFVRNNYLIDGSTCSTFCLFLVQIVEINTCLPALLAQLI